MATTKTYLSTKQVAEIIGAKDPTLSGYDLPAPDAVTGPIADDGSYPRGTVRGWTERTIEKWNESRPKRK